MIRTVFSFIAVATISSAHAESVEKLQLSGKSGNAIRTELWTAAKNVCKAPVDDFDDLGDQECTRLTYETSLAQAKQAVPSAFGLPVAEHEQLAARE